MAAPLAAVGYEHVLSQAEVADIRRLLRIAERTSSSTSLTMSRALTGSGSLSSLRGLGREIWADEDAQVYVRRLRDEWGP